MTNLPPRTDMGSERLLSRVVERLIVPATLLFIVSTIGTIGYKLIGGLATSPLDAAYMTFITIATIGFHEVIDVTHNPVAQVFTMFIAATGILSFSYMMSAITAFIVEGEVNQVFRRRRMQKRINSLTGHYIVCGIGRVGSNVAHELDTTTRQYVAIDTHQGAIDRYRERYPEMLWLHGDSSDDEMLIQAGVAKAAGVFAVTGDDSKNLVITLSAKQLNPALRVVARCHEINYMEKMRRVGADAIVSPDFTGGMRIASSMIRPHVVSFLDEMLRHDRDLRVEEIHIREQMAGQRMGDLGLRSTDYVVLAVREAGNWIFNPGEDHELATGATLIAMATPAGRRALEQKLG